MEQQQQIILYLEYHAVKQLSTTILDVNGGMNVRNQDIRQAAKKAGVFLWQIAAKCGMNDGNFSRKLREELPMNEKQKILGIIEDLAQERREVV